MTARVGISLNAVALAAIVLAAAWAVQGRAAAQNPGSDPTAVVAKVNGKPIRAAEVDEAIASVVAGKQIPPQAMAQLRAEALAVLIDRRLVENSLVTGGIKVTQAEIDSAQAKFATQLEGQKSNLEKYLTERELSYDSFRRQLTWQLIWETAVQKQLTDDVIKSYFDANRKDYDGTEVRVSHILFRPAKGAEANAVTTLIRDATAVREQIEAGKLTFAQAAAKYSTGPSRDQGGDLGFMPRHGLMVEPFSRAAFALEKGKISQPVSTPFGVHLLIVTDQRAGSKSWRDVLEEIKPPSAQYLFEQIAKRERDKAVIQFVGNVPHFKLGTRELVAPELGSK